MKQQLTVARPNISQGIAWMKAGWTWFRLAPIPWMGMTALAFLLLTGIGMLPKAGGLIVETLSPFLVAGFMSASRAAESGQPLTFMHLAAGFRTDVRIRLLIMGVAYLAGVLLINVITHRIGGDSFTQITQLAHSHKEVSPEQARTLLRQAVPAILVWSVLMIPLVMATWFAPALVLFNKFSTGNAMWWSLWACLVNWRPILIYSLWLGLLGVVAVLVPFGLGLLVLMPWAMASTYAAYRSMFVTVESV